MQYGDEIDNDCDGEIDEERADGKGMIRYKSMLQWNHFELWGSVFVDNQK